MRHDLPAHPRPEPGDVVGWRRRALCIGLGAELFFPVGEVGPDAVEQAEEAKAVCRDCPVRGPCLDYAVATNQQFGVWGGLTVAERQPLRRAGWRSVVGIGTSPADNNVELLAGCATDPCVTRPPPIVNVSTITTM